MKKTILVTLLLVFTQYNFSAESKFEDVPLSLKESKLQEIEALSFEYEQQSKNLLPYFNTELVNRGGEAFYIVTRLYQDEFYEQIFVAVEKYENGVYVGTIANDPAGKIDFNNGDKIQVKQADVLDWTIINNDGTEQGNYLGKFLDLYRAGLLNFFFYLNPLDGKVNQVKFVAAVNPVTKQYITELVPKEVIQKAQTSIEQEYLGRATTSTNAEMVYNFVKYPSWEMVSPEDNADIKSQMAESTSTNKPVHDAETELAMAVELGNLLTNAVNDKKHIRLKRFPEYRAINAYLKTNKCPGYRYKAYKVSAHDSDYFYLIGSRGKSVIIGRHFKVPIIDGAIDVDSFESSTKSCLDIGIPTPNVAGMMATHLKPYPNEFHVLQSNLASMLLHIGTSEKRYSIDAGVIEVLK